MKKYILILVVLSAAFTAIAQTKTITIDSKGSGDYTTIRAAFNSINGTTISQPHVFKIKAGWYEEWCQLKDIKGTSSTNTITVESFSGDSSDVWITNDTTSIFQARGVFDFNNVSHVFVQNISYRGPLQEGTTVGIGPNVSNIHFDKCHFVANYKSSKNNFAITPLLDLTGTATNADYITVSNCHVEDLIAISDGYGLIKFNNLTVRNNTLEWNYTSQPNPLFRGSEILIEDNFYNYATMGIFVGDVEIIRRNTVVSRVQCLSISQSDIRKTPVEIYNNFFIGDKTSTLVIDGNRANISFNNFNVLNDNNYEAAIVLNNADSLTIRNNNFKTNGKNGTCILNFDTSFSPEVTFDYNNYYNVDGFIYTEINPMLGYVTQTTLADFKKRISRFEKNGVSMDPFYLGDGDLHISNASLQGKAQPISSITKDIDGNVRDKDNPDIGADEMQQVINLAGFMSDTLIGSFYPGRAVEASYTVKNIGGLDWKNGTWFDKAYLSKDTILSSDDVLVKELKNAFSLKAGESYNKKFSINVPRIAAGDYHILVDINSEDLDFEFKLDDNVIVSKSYTMPVADFPDLVVDSVVVPPSIFSGKEFRLTWYVTNKGTAQTSGKWKDFVLLADDTTDLNSSAALTSDSLVRFRIYAPAGLKPGETYSNSVRVSIPLLYSGNLYYRVQTNPDGDIFEQDTTYQLNGRNSKALNVKQSPLPDLIPTELNIQSTAFSGQKIPFNYKVLNKGNLTTYRPVIYSDNFLAQYPSMWTDRIFISKSPFFTGLDDLEFKTFYNRPNKQELAPDSAYFVSDSIQFDICEYGKYYVYAFVNFNESTFELSFRNNVVMLDSIDIVLLPNPDLSITNVNPSANLSSGKEMELEYTVLNDGFSDKIGRHVDQYYIHSTSTYQKDEVVLLGTSVINDTVLKGKTYTKKVTLNLPYDLSGQQYITIVSDVTDVICEAPNDEQNIFTKTVSITLSPQPDLLPSFVDFSDTVSAGSTVQLITRVKNVGAEDANQSFWKNQLLLSGPKEYTTKRFNHAKGLPKDQEYLDTISVYIPLEAEQGEYSWLLDADYENQLVEYGFEQNNQAASNVIYVKRDANKVPDLELLSITADASITAGSVLDIEYELRNNSASTRSSGWKDLIELRDENNMLIKSYLVKHIGQISNGQVLTKTQQIKLPYNFSGDCKIVYTSNVNNNPTEYVLSNNSQEFTITIDAYIPPDLIVTNLSTDQCCSVNALQKDSIEIDLRNIGTGDVPHSFVSKIYISKDQVLDDNDVLLRAFKPTSMSFPADPTMSNPVKLEIQYPNYTNGEYYFIVEVDSKDTVYEATKESNNVFVTNFTTSLSNKQTNLVIDSFSVNGYSGADDSYITIDYVASKPVSDKLDRNFQVNASLVSESGQIISIGNDPFNRVLNQGKDTFHGKIYGYVRDDITPGNYTFRVHIDNQNVVFETDDRDNIMTTSKDYRFDFSTEITMDVLANGTFSEQAFNQKKYYRVKRDKDQGMLVSLDMEYDRSRTEMYHRVEDIPTSLRYDNKYDKPNRPDQEIIVPVIDSNVTDYIQVIANYTPPIVDFVTDPFNKKIDRSPFTILCESKTYSIYQTTPSLGTVYGNTSVVVEGFDFKESTQIYLVNGSDTIVPFENNPESSSKIATVFDFRNTRPGMYDVVAETDGTFATLPNYFNVSDTTNETISAWIETDFTPIELTTNFSTLNVHFGNYGYNDGYDYWLVVGIAGAKYKNEYLETKYVGSSEEEEIEALIERLGIDHPNPALDSNYVDIDSIRYYAFWIPKLAAKMNNTFTFKVNSTEPDHIYVNTILYPKSLSQFTITGREEDLWSCETMQEIDLYARKQLNKLGKSSGFDCDNIDMNKVHAEIFQETWKVAKSSNPATTSVSKIAQEGVSNWKKNFKSFNPKDQAKSQGKDLVKGIFKDREKSVTDHVKEGFQKFVGTYDPKNVAEKVFIPQDIPFADLTKNVFDCIDFDQAKSKKKCFREIGVRGSDDVSYTNDCSPSGASKQNSGKKTSSWDPNEIIGPAGVTSVQYIDKEDELIYTIYFENLETASAPAISVGIDNPLDTSFRLQEFGIMEIGFGDTSISFNGENNLDTRIQLGANYNNAGLQVIAGLNTVTNASFWQLVTIDPETGNQLNNPFGGFLPPNDSTGRGEGYVRYRIKLKSTVGAGYELLNNADIIFDQNEIISTNTWSNIVSDGSPQSQVVPLPAISSQSFKVSWSGTDGESGPGIKGYEVYVSDNNGSYTPWITFTTDTSAQFTGEANHEYRFYSVVVLNDGQREIVPVDYDAITKIDNSSVDKISIIGPLVLYPNPGKNQVVISGIGTLEAAILDVHGKTIVQKLGGNSITINTTDLSAGMYFIRVSHNGNMSTHRWLKQE